MKTIVYFTKLITFFTLLFFVSCQDEVTEITQPTEQEALVPDTPLAQNIFNMSTLSSSASSIVTNTTCLTVDLPFSVIVNGIEISVETDEDYDIIATIFDEKTIKAVFLTHFHPDHALGLLRLRYSSDTIDCYHPKDEDGFADLFKHKKL